MNYISVKGALVKSNTWDLGKKSRRGHGEESPMCAVVIEMPCLRLSQRRPSFSHFMFANKGFSVKKCNVIREPVSVHCCSMNLLITLLVILRLHGLFLAYLSNSRL